MALRPTTNLIVPQHLMLPKKALKEKFLYVYTGAYTGSPTAFMTKLWASTFFPSITKNPSFGKTKPRAVSEALGKRVPAGYLRVKKVMDPKNPHFVVSVPLYSFVKHNTHEVVHFLENALLGYEWAKKRPETTAETHVETRNFVETMRETSGQEIVDQTIPTAKVIENMGLDALGSAALKNSLLQVRVQTKGNAAVIFADFKVTKEEAQQLTTTEWTELRDIDLYPLLLHWVTVGFGARGIAPTAAFPISKIAFSLPPAHSESARVNDLNLAVGPNGRPYYLPRVVDKKQTIAYEDKYSAAGAREDGSFTLHEISEGAMTIETGQELKTKLPANMVVSIDWLNNKYAYTNTKGFLDIEDLTRFQAADVTHIRTLLDERGITDKEVSWFVNMGIAAGVPPSEFRVTEDDLFQEEGLPVIENRDKLIQASGDPNKYFEEAVRAWVAATTDKRVPFSEISTHGFTPFVPLAKYFKRIEAAVKDNIEAVYLKYSVTTVMTMFPWLVMIAHYTDDMVGLRAKDVTNRSAALNQNIDPNWQVPSVPLVKKDMGLLPHQVKVQNIMKDDPEVAIMPIQTGGGKTPSLLIDLLLRFKANESAPYLVLCPNHLVPNYVKEAVYFTDGKLNVIAITNTAIRQNGWKRLQAIVEAMPRNTVVVVALDTLRFRPRSVSYGTSPTTIFPVIDFLRQFKFGYVAIDEAHRIKGKTARNKATMALIADIPKKRLASGTFVHDSPSDLAMTIAALDPTLFGTREEFNERYGDVVRGSRVIRWREGAQKAIMEKIKTRVVVAGAMRKEWAAFLPKKVEWIGAFDLTEPQQAVYEDLLNEAIEKITQDAKTNKELQKFLSKKSGAKPAMEEPAEESDEEEEEGERAIDEDEGEDLAQLLNPYLARLEQYLIAPGRDPLGKKLLKGEDLLSPKVAQTYHRIRLHLFGGEVRNPKTGQMAPYGPFPGKVIVFVNQIAAAEEIFDKAPPDLKKSGLLYKAAEKVEILSQLEKNPNKKWVVGVVQSMEEGLNLQFGSRIIRVSSPWNPGNLEQSNARIERPEFKKKETRSQIFFDTIVANRTYDITKNARLIAKVIAAAKFENTDNPEYDQVPDMPIIPMTLDTIRSLNSWQYVNDENPGLLEYAKALQVYEGVRNADYEAYKQAYIAKHGEGPVMSPIEIAPTPPDAKLLLRTPYVPGLGLYNEQEMGLVRLDEYLNLDPDIEEENGDDNEEQEEEIEEENSGPSELQLKAEALKGQLVHTEFGEGYIKHLNPKYKTLSIELVNGYRVRVHKSQVFVITRTLTSNKDIRNLVLRSIGKLPISTPVDVPAEGWKASKKAQELQRMHEEKQVQKEQKQREQQKQRELNIELTPFVVNGFLGLDYEMDEENQTAMKVLQGHGFRSTAPYYYAKVVNSKALDNQMKMWRNKGLTVDPLLVKQNVLQAFLEMYNLLQSGKIKSHQETFKAARGAQIVNFYRLEHKPSNRKDLFKPYPIIQDGQAFIALPTGQAGTREAMKYKRPSFRWKESVATLSYFGSMQQVVKVIKELEAAGVHISNIKELMAELSKMKLMKVRSPDEGLL